MQTVSPVIVIMCIAVAFISVAACFMSKRWSGIVSYVPLVVLSYVSGAGLTDTVIFWGIAAFMATAINYLLPRGVSCNRTGVGYLTGAGMAGAFVGILLSTSGIVIGSVAGVFIGGIAFARTPRGRVMGVMSREFFNYMCAKGLPAVVVTSIAAIVFVISYYDIKLF